MEALLQKFRHAVSQYKKGFDTQVYPYEITEILVEIRVEDEQKFLELFDKLPEDLKAAVLVELPSMCHEEMIEHLSPNEIATLSNTLDTDDAAELIRNIEEVDHEVAVKVLEELPTKDRKNLEALIAYGENEAGAYMQTELFSAYVDEQVGNSIRRLKRLKDKKEIDNVYQVYVITRDKEYLGSIALEDLILLGAEEYYEQIIKSGLNRVALKATDDIQDVVEIAANYDMNVIPIVDDADKLIGRITADDIYDIIEERATDQLFNLAGVSDTMEKEEKLFSIGKKRAYWLGINLLTAVLASIVIGLFDATLQSLVALAVLMPIVASMGGNAGTQTLTVTVRQMTLGTITLEDAKKTIKKEVFLALMNGLIFAIVMGIVAWLWFDMKLLGVVMGLAMIINLFFAGFFGAVIPLILEKLQIDPAVGSSVILTTVTDIVGFFSFLGLASLMLL